MVTTSPAPEIPMDELNVFLGRRGDGHRTALAGLGGHRRQGKTLVKSKRNLVYKTILLKEKNIYK